MMQRVGGVAILFLALLALISYLFERELRNFQEEDLRQKVAKVHRIFDAKIEQKRYDLDYYLQRILGEKELLEALKEEKTQKIDLLVSPHYDTLSRFDTSIKILTFRTKEGITLYRAHKKEFYGDTLSEKRAIILDTDAQQRSLSGFEVGKLAITYRVTRPIFYENEYIGNVEIGADPTLMLQDLSTLLDADVGVAAQNRFVEVMEGSNVFYIGDKLFMLHGNRNLEGYFSKRVQNKNGYIVDTSLDLKNHNEELIGYLILGFDMQKQFGEHQERQEKFFWLLALVAGLFFALFAFLFSRANGWLQRGDASASDSLHLAKILKEGSVVPYFQPIVDAEAKVVKYEALMRIVYKRGREKKVLLPEDFLKEALRDASYISLFQNMIRKSLHRFRDKEEMISLNFLPEDLLNLYIMQEFVQNIKMFDAPSRVIVEISEVECAKNFAKLLQVAKKLKELGVSICIDDFEGTVLDYSTLLAINPSYIKINGALIAKAKTTEGEKIRSIVEFAKENQIKTAAEFVTDEETFALLKIYGVDEFQGHYFGEARETLEHGTATAPSEVGL